MSSHLTETLFLSDKFSDITFIVENQAIPAHKLLLALSCPYFESMLFGATNESKLAIIELKYVSHKDFLEVLRAVYLQKVVISEWTPDEVKELVQIADEYQFQKMGRLIAESVNIDTQITIDEIEDVVGAATRLNCRPLMDTCVNVVRKRTEFLFSNEEAFDKLPMVLISDLIDANIWHAGDVRLVHSIANWKKSASVKDRKFLLSKIEWKSLPARYSAALLRVFLEDDGHEGIQSRDWTEGLKCVNVDADMIAGFYIPNSIHSSQSSKIKLLSRINGVINNEVIEAYAGIFLRQSVTNVKTLQFEYTGKAEIMLTLCGEKAEIEICGTNMDSMWHFNLPSGFEFSSAFLEILNEEFGDPNYDSNASHDICNLKFCFNEDEAGTL